MVAGAIRVWPGGMAMAQSDIRASVRDSAALDCRRCTTFENIHVHRPLCCRLRRQARGTANLTRHDVRCRAARRLALAGLSAARLGTGAHHADYESVSHAGLHELPVVA